MTAKTLRRAGQLFLALAGLALVTVPIGVRFTGRLLFPSSNPATAAAKRIYTKQD